MVIFKKENRVDKMNWDEMTTTMCCVTVTNGFSSLPS